MTTYTAIVVRLMRPSKESTYMCVADDNTLTIECLRGSKVVGLGINEVSSLEGGKDVTVRSLEKIAVRTWRFFMAIWMVNCVLALIVSPFFGETNFEEGILFSAGITPIGAGLQEPVVICFPSVIGRLGTVRQKFMKLFVDVKEETWPTSRVNLNF
jgi:hypothetical protein